MLRTRQRYQPAEKLAMVEYLPLGGDNITTRGFTAARVEATYAEFGGLVVDVRQPV
jgi:hypothetical protein